LNLEIEWPGSEFNRKLRQMILEVTASSLTLYAADNSQ